MVSCFIEAYAIHVVRIVQLELVCEQDWIDLVDDLFGLLDWGLDRLFLCRTERSDDVLLPNNDQLLQNIDIINNLWEAAHSYTAARFLKVTQSTGFEQRLPSIVTITTDE